MYLLMMEQYSKVLPISVSKGLKLMVILLIGHVSTSNLDSDKGRAFMDSLLSKHTGIRHNVIL